MKVNYTGDETHMGGGRGESGRGVLYRWRTERRGDGKERGEEMEGRSIEGKERK